LASRKGARFLTFVNHQNSLLQNCLARTCLKVFFQFPGLFFCSHCDVGF